MIFLDAKSDDGAKYTIDIANESGVGSCDFNVGVKATPGKPRGPLEASDITRSTCKLRWKAPEDDGGCKLQNYIVERREKGKPFWTTVSSFCKV